MPRNRLIQDVLKVAADAEDVARRFAKFRDIPDPIKASILTRVLQLKDLLLLMVRELKSFKGHRGDSTVAV